MAFFKLSFVCQLDYHLGPLQISLGKMTKDVAKFIVIFGIVLFAFSSGLAKLYQYYDEMIFVDDDSKLKTQQVGSFVSFASSIKTLFWAIFCMSPIESADVVIENLPGDTEVETIVNQHTFTETIGYVAFAGFEFISVVVMLNMLLACMTNTFTRVTQRVDVEWTFGRTEVGYRFSRSVDRLRRGRRLFQVYIEFMAQTALPPPFNLIPTPRAIGVTVEFFKVLFKPTPDKRVRWNLKNCCYIVSPRTADCLP
ncbi:short transient receptor potential channel 5-like isoform X2 [Orussus abietinus]|uniref:short transient receptor potential channel 5-like isoform X2 n=1 Tax=Orussus abietinus TaxID=222816 RepID=UPI000C716090|nr:short transient receptor potential channel 5-like isoform X2 [Orussus abietinus]